MPVSDTYTQAYLDDPYVPMPEASRSNAGKSPMNLVEPEFMLGVGYVMGEGAKKYAVDNWKRSLNTTKHDEWVQTCHACMMRHALAAQMGEEYDQETGLSHMYHVATNAMFIDFYNRNKEEF